MITGPGSNGIKDLINVEKRIEYNLVDTISSPEVQEPLGEIVRNLMRMQR